MAICTSAYMEIMLENDKREESNNTNDIKKFIPIQNLSVHLTNPEEFKKNHQSNHGLIKKIIDENTVSILEMFKDKKPKCIRVYTFAKRNEQDKEDLIRMVDEYGNVQFMNYNQTITSIDDPIEEFSFFYSRIAGKWIKNEVVISSMNSDYSKHL
jgi:hypothetical protein